MVTKLKKFIFTLILSAPLISASSAGDKALDFPYKLDEGAIRRALAPKILSIPVDALSDPIKIELSKYNIVGAELKKKIKEELRKRSIYNEFSICTDLFNFRNTKVLDNAIYSMNDLIPFKGHLVFILNQSSTIQPKIPTNRNSMHRFSHTDSDTDSSIGSGCIGILEDILLY